jgi:hypothetical protein
MNKLDASTRILVNLLKLIKDAKSTSEHIISYLKHHSIQVNTYIPQIDVNQPILPLIYHLCSRPDFEQAITYLIQQGLNIHLEQIGGEPIELLYYTQIPYIPQLYQAGFRLKPERLEVYGSKLLIQGNITKLMALYRIQAISRDDLIKIINQSDLVFKVLDALYERMFYISQQKSDIKNKCNELMKNYVAVFKLILKNGVDVNQRDSQGETLIQKVLNTYFYDIIKVITDMNPNFEQVEFHHISNFPQSTRQVLAHFYNDENYHLIHQLISTKLTPDKINVKRKLMGQKKITHSL